MIPALPDGPLLALDTSGALGTVAVGTSSGVVLGRVALDRPGGFSASLVPAVDQALAAAGVRRDALAGVVVGAGPGSFTGVRVAGATGRGIAHALGIPFWAVSSLAAGALSGVGLGAELGAEHASDREAGALRYVLFDARDDRLYAACYACSAAGLEERITPRATSLSEVLAAVPEGRVAFVGDGAVRHRAAIEAAGHPVLPPPAGVPTADALLRLLGLGPRREPLRGGATWEPAYLKASNAERARAG